jgi:hypothetical protein
MLAGSQLSANTANMKGGRGATAAKKQATNYYLRVPHIYPSAQSRRSKLLDQAREGFRHFQFHGQTLALG